MQNTSDKISITYHYQFWRHFPPKIILKKWKKPFFLNYVLLYILRNIFIKMNQYEH